MIKSLVNTRRFNGMRVFARFSLLLAVTGPVMAGDGAVAVRQFVEKNCVECHDADTKKGGLDLSALKFDPANLTNFSRWVLVQDRVSNGEMPPKKKPRPEASELEAFTKSLSLSLVSVEQARMAKEGRATRRRLNRYEYENALRDLLHAPWLQVRDSLPEDGEADRFNKIGDALDVSHVQMARYLGTADYALRQAMATQVERPKPKVKRYYARDQRSYTGPMKFNVFNTAPERATFPVLGFQGQPDVRKGDAPITSTNAELRELEGVGVVASAYEPIEPKFNQFRAPVAGHYKLRFNAYSVWVGPGESNKWFIPNLDDISKGRRDEPVTDRKSTRLNSSHSQISYAVFCLNNKKTTPEAILQLMRTVGDFTTALSVTLPIVPTSPSIHCIVHPLLLISSLHHAYHIDMYTLT